MLEWVRFDIMSDVALMLNTGQTMPHARRAPRKRARARKSPKAMVKALVGGTLDMEEPLAEATRLVCALRMIGDGMELDGADEGGPITSVARAAVHQLDDLKRIWTRTLRTAQGRPA